MTTQILFLAQGTRSDQSTQHRITPIAEELENRGYNCNVCYGINQSLFGRSFKTISIKGTVHFALNADAYDVLVINRDASPLTRLCAIISRRSGAKIIFDLDDALYNQKSITGTDISHPTRIHLEKIIKLSDHVTTGNDTIRESISGPDTDVTTLPTPVDPSVFHPNTNPVREYDVPVVGWMGVGHGHEKNLRLLRDPLIEIGKEKDFVFRIISALGNEEIYRIFEGLEEFVEVDYGHKSRIPIEQIAREMATFDVAALPLNRDDEMMEGKSIIKVIEHAAMKIPVIASNTLSYGDVITHDETGLLSDTEEDWVRNLNRLITDAGERDRLGAAGYEMVHKRYTVGAYVDGLERIIRSFE